MCTVFRFTLLLLLLLVLHRGSSSTDQCCGSPCWILRLRLILSLKRIFASQFSRNSHNTYFLPIRDLRSLTEPLLVFEFLETIWHCLCNLDTSLFPVTCLIFSHFSHKWNTFGQKSYFLKALKSINTHDVRLIGLKYLRLDGG